MNCKRNLRLQLALLACIGIGLAAPARAHEGHHHTAMGTVKAIDAAKLDLETTDGKLESFVLTAGTTYKRGDVVARREDVSVAARAAVTYEMKDGKNIAIEVRLGAKDKS